jgi:hypothetical protein
MRTAMITIAAVVAAAGCDSDKAGKGGASVGDTSGEAERSLGAIQKGAKALAVDGAGFPVGDTGLTPDRPCCEQGGTCKVDSWAWLGDDVEPTVWNALGFKPDNPHRFQYSYEGSRDRFTVRAVGDTDCDGTAVEYVLDGAWNDGRPTFELRKPANAD